MDVDPGLRVVRGPDWEWGDQDGGEGHVGTVVEVGEPTVSDGGRAVVVQWDCGERSRYRCGVTSKYDLRILDSAPAGLKHIHTRCHGCNEDEIAGILWQCRKCFEYFLCTPCYMVGRHSLEHAFLRIDTHDLNQRVLVPARARSLSVRIRGIFPGAKVMRGHNWKWGNQDGGKGNIGVIIKIMGWQNESTRSVVEVLWVGNYNKNIYRLGHKGKVDLRLIQSGEERVGHYYPAHLPLLGAAYEPPKETVLAAGDRIKVELNPDVWKILQEGHGGWNDLMSVFIDTVGVIVHIADDGDLVVNYHSNAMFHINAAAATKVDTTVFHSGDVIRVMDDRGEVSKLQKGHGEWNDSMSMSLGQVARVVKVLPSGDVRISVSGRRWIFNPACLKHAPGERAITSVELEAINPILRTQLRAMIQRLDPDTVATAAAAGDSVMLREFLAKRPGEVNTKLQGKTALHIAAAEGFIHVLKVLLDYGPDLNTQDNEGDTPLHICAHMNQEVVAELLVRAGADVNYKNAVGLFPLAVAAAIGNHSTLRVFVNSPGIDLNDKDLEGNTALHISVLAHRNECVAILLDAGADPTVYNSSCFSPLLEAAKNGFYAGIEQFIGRFPEHANMIKMDDGHTALHIAAANDHLDIVSLLCSLESCDINASNFSNSLTPLHLAAQRGYSRIIEALVGYGADINATAGDGQTILHLILTLKGMQPPSQDAPEFLKMSEHVRFMTAGQEVPPYVAMACLLVREGANWQTASMLGVDVMALCPPEMAPIIHQVASESRRSRDERLQGSFARYGPRTFKTESIWRVQEVTRKRRSSPIAVTHTPVKSVTTSSPVGRSIPVNSTIRTTTEERPVSPTATLPYDFQPLATTTEAQGQHIHRPLVLQGDDQSTTQRTPPLSSVASAKQKSVVKICSTDVQSTQSAAILPEEECILCDSPANCQFIPCGHTVMCMECGKRPKKCPECKTVVERIRSI